MKKKGAKIVAGSLCGIFALISPMQSIATTAISQVENGISYTDYAGSGHEGYSVVETDASALTGDTLVIPESVNGKDVIHLGSNFLSKSGARKVEIGKNIIGLSADAFFEARQLEEITSNSRAFAVSDDDPALYTYQHAFLLDYPSAASDGNDYTVHEATRAIYSMDNADFGRLDLGKADTLTKHALMGTKASELAMADNMQTTMGSSSVRLSLPGLHAGSFSLTSAGAGSYLRTDGESLYTSDGTLIKLASGVESGVDWSVYREIDTDAFDSMAQYWSLSNSIPDSLKRDKVFHFYNQNNGVFIVNDQTAFCYNSNLHIPDKVTDSADFSSVIDGANYDKVNAVMFVGVPYDGAGLFEEIFGVSYEEAIQDAEMSRNGNAALNAVSSMIWELVDGKPSDIIDGVGNTSYFTEENVRSYTAALREAASHPGDYTFSPAFEIDGGILIFREQKDGTFLSDPFRVAAVDGNGDRNDNYKIHMTLSGEGFGIYGSSSMDFLTGDEIRLTSKTKPEGQPLSFTYEKGSLKYYAPGSSGEQNLLVSGKKDESTVIQYAFEVKPVKEDLILSKRAVGGSGELAGATLKLTDTSGIVVDEWVSGSEPHTISMPEDGSYTLTETMAPDGFLVAESITFTVAGGTVENGMVIMYDAPEEKELPSFRISKQDVTTNKELPGASLKLTDNDGNTVEEWVSADEPYVIEGFSDGTYTLVEAIAPEGYKLAESITFIVKDGTVEGGRIVMYDAPEKPDKPEEPDEKPFFNISKRDVATGKELPGASLKVTDNDGKVVEEWVSSDEPHVVKGLADGTYILTEVTAPEDYVVAENITFTVKAGTVEGGMIVMYDEPETKSTPSEPDRPTPSEPDKPDTPDKPEGCFYISKRDVANSEELPGAKLKLTDKDGNIVEEWISGNMPHKVIGLDDGEYTLTETMAPQGYQVAKSITFAVKDRAVENGVVVMYDKALPSKPAGNGGGGHSGGGGVNHSSGSDMTHGPGVVPHTEEPPALITTPEPELSSEPIPSHLPKTDDQPPFKLIFWAAALTLAGILVDKKRCKTSDRIAR